MRWTARVVGIGLLLFAVGTALAQEEPGPEASALIRKAEALDKAGQTTEALALLKRGLARFTRADYDRFFTLNLQFSILARLGRLDEAVKVAEEKAEIIRSPRQALMVAQTHLSLGHMERALEWIGRSVERGLQSYTVFDATIYDPLRGHPRFGELVDVVKRRNGLGLPAPAFRRESISGRPLSLDDYRGKVVLLDFWATSCGPCLDEMPNLKRLYDALHAQGFDILGFSLDQDVKVLTAFLEKHAVRWENVLCPGGEADDTVRLFKVVNIPASFLVDRTGVVRHVNLTGKDLDEAVRALVNTTTTSEPRRLGR